MPPVSRVPLLYGSRLTVVRVGEDDVVVAPPPPPAETIADVGAAVRDALRFPLTGPPLESLVPRGGRATILVELPALPIPLADHDPRQAALVGASDELERLGVPTQRQTILFTAGLARRPTRKTIERLVAPEFALRFHGRVASHDAEAPELVEVGRHGALPLRVHPSLVETDAVVVVSSAQTVLDGGPATLLSASSAETQRGASAESLLETHLAPGWDLALAIERAVGARVPLIGASLTLDLPLLSGTLRGYPHEPEAVERVASSRLGRIHGLLPAWLRALALSSLPIEVTTSAAYAGPPSVAHAEALVRSVETASATIDRPLDAICLGIPRTTPFLPRERPNALIATTMGLGHSLRLWRDTFPVRAGGTAILVNPFRRRFAHPTQSPYRAFFQAVRSGRDPDALAAAEQAACEDTRALEAYRAASTCHPRLPFADWDSCRPALDRLGAVIVAGCRDSAVARQLGFVPTHGVSAAIEMAEGLAGGRPRIGFVLSPPYFPLRTAPSEGT